MLPAVNVPWLRASVGLAGDGWPLNTLSIGAAAAPPTAATDTSNEQVLKPAFTWAWVGGQAADGSGALNWSLVFPVCVTVAVNV